MTEPLGTLLVTGAAGTVAQQVIPHLAASARDLRLSDLVTPARQPANAEFIRCDLTDLTAFTRLMSGVDYVVHLAGIPIEADFDTLLGPNIVAVHNLYEAARANGCPRIVFASSNHVVGFHDQATRLTPDSARRPDSWYGVTKVFGEAVAQFYFDKVGQETALVRIGSVTPAPTDYRMLSTWMSARDFATLCGAAFSAPALGCRVIFGASNNALSWWDNSAHADLGWHPQDSADEDEPRLRPSRPGPDHPSRRYQGGTFAAAPIRRKDDP
ncbi:MAG: NAD(P)-dependent oxidoreductase [Pseudomonadota bacterium]